MFDPTIYDNLKVVIEGTLYDLDLAGRLDITSRSDRVELSTMSRSFLMECRLKPTGVCSAIVNLQADLSDLAAEILERAEMKPGCHFYITFQSPVHEPIADSAKVLQKVRAVWGDRPQIKQTVSYSPDEEQPDFHLMTSLHFGRKLDEGQLEDIPDLLDHIMQTLQALDSP